MPSRRPFRAPGRARAILLTMLVAAALVAGAQLSTDAVLGRDLAVDLSMHYIHQYLGNASDNHDCGPASIAMVLDAYGLRPSGSSDARLVQAVRKSMGVPNTIGTVYDDLERSLKSYGLRYSLIPSGLAGEPGAEARLMQGAVDDGELVIAMIHGAVLGRGEDYEDHWVVVAGFTGDSVHVLDPDDQVARTSGWVRGGDITLSLGLFEQAGLRAQPGPYAIVIYPPGRRPPLQVGDGARVAGTDGDGAFLRSSPGIGDNKLTLLPEGTAVTVRGPLPPPSADGHDWVGVTVNGQQGYVAADYIAVD